MNYQFDGTIDGFFTLIYEAFEKKEFSIEISREKTLFNKKIVTDRVKSEKVAEKLNRILNSFEMTMILTSFLSKEKNVDNLLFRYIYLRLKKRKIDKELKLSLELIRKSVSFEAHKYLGFVRFKELKNGYFYSPIEPENNILPLISEHFFNRMKSEKFVIHDVKRNLVYMYGEGRGEFKFLKEANSELLEKNSDLEIDLEKNYQELWKTFHESIAIKDRKNLRCQQNFMSKKYWKYLTEKN